jgi:hypothetical protein
MNNEPSKTTPDFETACQWWSDLPNIWTPIGWKDHLYKFNVLWNGTVLAEPKTNRRAVAINEQGVQVAFVPQHTNSYTEYYKIAYLQVDDGVVTQGWDSGIAPVLWSEWARDGVKWRQHVFAHTADGGPTKNGVEPMFAWIRMQIHDLCSALPLEAVHGFQVLLHNPHLTPTMELRDNVRFWHELSLYPKALHMDPQQDIKTRGAHILDSDEKVRFAVAPGKRGPSATVEFFQPDDKDYRKGHRLYVQVPSKKGVYVDLLLPMTPMPREVFDRELALGYDGALKQANAFWKKTLHGTTRISLPEPALNEAIRESVRFSHVLTERNPETGKLCKINGSWAYAELWTTPVAMDFIMMMDTLGYHSMVQDYLSIFKEEQGTVIPPGPAYEKHPGYLSSPARYKSVDWLADNGAVLWTLCMHYLLSGDHAYLTSTLDAIIKSCDWIKTARAIKGHGGYEKVLPPAVATDAGTQIQAIWSIGWNYKGLTAAVRILKEIGHPRAGEFEEEANAYRADFLVALRHKCKSMPTWKDSKGRRRQFIPTALAGDDKAESRHAFYLDAGPLFLVFAGLLNADDALMKDTLAWFREGPQRAYNRNDSNCWQVPVLNHEMSSCEPCYSWNVFHSWQSGDRVKFLEGMYSLFAGSMSRKTWVSCETRGGITGNIFSATLAIYLARLAMIDDQIKPDELHLLRLMPDVWLRPHARCEFDLLPTEYGPVTLHTAMDTKGGKLSVTFKPRFRKSPKKVILHLQPGIKQVVINGQKRAVPKTRELVLTA